MQITFDPRTLSRAQLQHIAGFLVTFPLADVPEAARQVATPEPAAPLAWSEPTPSAIRLPATLAPADAPDAGIPSPASAVTQAATDAILSGAEDAAAAFGNPDPAQAFGAAPEPVVVPQVPAVPSVPTPPAVAPVVPPVPQATPTPTPAPSNTPEHNFADLDSEGLPWDTRIHAASKTKIKSGTWRSKNGLHEAFVSQVKNELRALMAAPRIPAPAVPSVPAVPTPPVATPAPAVPPVPQAPVTTDADPKAPFTALVGRCAGAMHASKITQAEANQICGKHGVPALPLLLNRLDLVPAIAAEIDALIASRG